MELEVCVQCQDDVSVMIPSSGETSDKYPDSQILCAVSPFLEIADYVDYFLITIWLQH